jgi:UDP-N-acetylmuramate--alanine ligase
MKIHFIGIGGIGMSALARYFLAQKWAVSGSDMVETAITRTLRKEGVRVKIGHKKGNLPEGVDMVVRSAAVQAGNPELRAARHIETRGLSRVLTYPEAVGEITKQYKTIAVAGAHGKSTTTALAALALVKGQLDPTVIIGTNLKEFGGRNFRSGKSDYFVLEADEFGNAFSHYSPALAIITNIDREHLDTYENLANIKKAFLDFINNIADGGTLIVNRDDDNLRSLESRIAAITKKKNIRVAWYSLQSAEARKIKKIIKIPGTHNVSNATAVYKLGKALGIPEKKILSAIGSYRGAWRRMEYRGKFRGALVYDDYAHHPTEIKATLKAFREKYPAKRILCVFQPHQAKRLAALFKEFTTAFGDADKTLILPIYKVAGRDERPSRFDSAALARAIQKREPKKLLFFLAEPKHLKKAVLSLAAPLSDHVIVMMGAGSIVNLTDSLLK